MIFTIKKSVTDSKGGTFEKFVPVLVSGTYNGQEYSFTVDELLASPDLVQIMEESGYYTRFGYSTGDGLLYPFSNSGTNCTSFLPTFREAYTQDNGCTPEKAEAFAARLAPKMNNDLKLAKMLVSGVFKFVEYEAQKTNVEKLNVPVGTIDPDLFADTQEFVKQLNQAAVKVFSHMDDSQNVTLKQKECTDEVFIQLPNLYQLQATEDMVDLVPVFGSVAVPYPPELKCAYTPDYRNLGVIPESMFPEIEGKADNNSLPVQPNERRLYDAICDWIKYNSKQTFGILPEKDSEIVVDSLTEGYLTELIGNIYSWYWGHNPNVPVVKRGLKGDDDDSDDSSESASSKYEYVQRSASVFSDDSASAPLMINAIMLLTSFVEKAKAVVGYQVYAEAVIKLLRWGSRKCSGLLITGYNQIFQLGTNTIRPYIGAISDYEPSTDAEGNVYSIGALVMCDTRVSDNGWLRAIGARQNILSIPVGVGLNMIMKNKNGGEDCAIQKYYAMPDFLNKIVSGEKIAGITMDGSGNITAPDVKKLEVPSITARDVVEFANNPNKTLLYDPIFSSHAIQDLYLELEVNGPKENHFTLLSTKLGNSNLGSNLSKVFYTKEELDEYTRFGSAKKIISKPLGISYRILSMILPIYFGTDIKFDPRGDGKDFERLLNLYKDVMLENDYAGEASFLKFPKVAPTHFRTLVPGYKAPQEERKDGYTQTEKEVMAPLPVKKETAAPVEAFAPAQPMAQPQQTVQEQPQQVAPVAGDTGYSLIRQPEENSVYVKLIASDGSMVGIASAVQRKVQAGEKPVTDFTLLPVSAADSVQASRFVKSINVRDVYTNLLVVLARIESKETEKINFFFDSIKTMSYYVSLFKKLAELKML